MLVRRFRKRNATVVVEASGEVLFAPGTELSRWKNRFSQRIRAATIKAAPMHNYGRRPLRPHPGPHLKETISASTTTRISRTGGRFYIAVGSSAKYALFVDQGTAGQAAKVLPPYSVGSPSLYWHRSKVPTPGGGWQELGPIFVRGQEAKHFFDTGLRLGFQSMMMRSYQVPGEGISGMRGALASMPEGLINAATASKDQGYAPSFREWVEWRDLAFKRHQGMGENGALYRYAAARLARAQARREAVAARRHERRAPTRAKHAARMREWRKQNKIQKMRQAEAAKSTKKPRPPAAVPANLQGRVKKSIAGYLAKHPGWTYTGRFNSQGFVVRDPKGNSHTVQFPVTLSSALHDATG